VLGGPDLGGPVLGGPDLGGPDNLTEVVDPIRRRCQAVAMTGTLDLDRVDELRIRLTYSRVLEGPAHDVFLLDTRPVPSTGRFDETSYLDCLEPVLHPQGEGWAPAVVHVNRTHRNWVESAGEAEIVVALATGRSTAMDQAATEAVGSVFAKILQQTADEPAAALGHRDALLEARLRIERAYAEVHADRLSVTDEEHVPASGMWSVGLVLDDRARFKVRIGFVDGDSRTTHIRCLPGSEIVDSVGTGGNG
jgi:hypothetical protein